MDVEKQGDPRLDGKRVGVAVDINCFAFDVLEDQIRLTTAGHAGIEQSRDVGVREPREDAALALKALGAAPGYQREV